MTQRNIVSGFQRRKLKQIKDVVKAQAMKMDAWVEL